jgi:DNA-binding response regulator, luxR family
VTRTLKDIQEHTLVRIVDDNEDLRETCEMMLTYAGWQVRTYAGAWSFLMDDAPSVPGCLILDISMPDMTGTELQMEMRRRRYSLPIIILTGHANVDLAVTTLKAGAAEFFEKPVDEDRLMKAIAKLCRESLAKSCGELTGRDLEKAFDLLTEREREILELMIQDVSSQQIAERLGLSDRTIYAHRNAIYRKLGTKNLSNISLEDLVSSSCSLPR